MVIRELLIRLGLTGSDEAGRRLDRVDNRVNSLTDSFKNLGSIISGVFAGIGIKSIIEAADHMQTLQFRLGQMPVSLNGAAEAFDNVAKHAQDSRVSIETYAEAYTAIGAATHDLIHTQGDLSTVVDTLAQGLQLAGASGQATSGVIQQLSQAFAVGKLQWEDFKVILQQSDAFAKRLGESMGMSLQQITQATQGAGGGIAISKIIAGIMKMSGQVKAEFKTMPLTVTQAITVIGVRWESFINRMNRSSTAITRLANWFLWLADKVEYALDVCVDALGGAENAVKLLTVAIGAAGLLGAIWLLPAAFAALTSPIALVIAALVLLYAVGDDVNRWLNGQSSLLERSIGPVKEYADQVNALSGFMIDLRDTSIWALNSLKKVADFFNAGQDFAQKWGDKLGTTKLWPWLSNKFMDSNENTVRGDDGSVDYKNTFSSVLAGFHKNVNDAGIYNPIPVTENNIAGLSKNPTQTNTVTVSIGSIEVPAGTGEQQVAFLKDAAQRTFAETGNDRFSSDSLLLNGGVNR
ncbi:tape measure domain-containing protein [Rosenbergiella nectarea]|uniref:Tape measure domain-containing protein n=1 Tax=Rosenbergiella nectarea TaxID=988801 RepID=A0A1H9HQP2_9GAMM|nr:tape measure protein [Rosenbergiella nectarea]SEQ64598.1 tape measure domain-containing protein [Rosenbergiella nectarea]